MQALGFWRLAAEDPDHVALVAPDHTLVRAGDLLATANRIVHGLRARGLGRGDVVACVLDNEVAVYALFLAIAQAGMYLVPLNVHLTAAEMRWILADSGARVLVVSPAHAAAALEATDLPADARFATGPAEGFRPLDDLTAGQPSTLPEDRCAGAVMNYTSGTTGRPKGVRRPTAERTPEEVAVAYAGFLMLFGIRPRDGVHIVVAPLYHTAVLSFSSSALHLGHTVVLLDRFEPRAFLDRVARYRVTHSHMVPTHFIRLLDLPEDERTAADVSSLRHVVHGAAPCPTEVKRRMLAWWGPVIYEYYAATEGGGTLIGPEEWLAHPGSVGKAWYGAEIRVLDDAGQDCAPDQVGTVYIRMPGHDFRYHDDDEKTRDNRRHGFFTVGDAGRLDAEGYLTLCDRKADLIIAGGVNIYPAEIEAALIEHPDVADVAVFGVPDADKGERVMAVVQPRTGADRAALLPALERFAEERLARYKRPRAWELMDELPRDPNGKLYKRRLRDPWWEGVGRAI